MKSIEISARTVAEAVELALGQLGRDRDEVAIAVLDAGERGDEALVRVSVVDDDEEDSGEAPSGGDVAAAAQQTLEDLLELMDIHGYVTAVSSVVPGPKGQPEETITLHVEGADEEAMGLMIGRRGETLRSLQYLLNLLVSRRVRRWPQLVVDVGNYRQRRQESLEGLARRMAERVRLTGRPIMLEPMGAYERRLVHLALRDDPSVHTESDGEGDQRKIVVHPARTALS